MKSSKKTTPFVLAILDGWGIGPKDNTNAIHLANTPVFDHLAGKYAYTQLGASGVDVGLNINQTSGSETGHMNIGAGRTVEQDSRIISESINSGKFFHNPAFLGALSHVEKNKSSLHLMGLLGNDDSPHMYPLHLEALLILAKNRKIKNVFIHFFSDGRDSYPKSAIPHLKAWQRRLKRLKVGKIVTIVGRFYAMDRSKHWDRLKKAYDLMVRSKGMKFSSPEMAIKYWYSRDIDDEYIEPSVIVEKGESPVKISDNDSIIFFNLRSDRARQLTKLITLGTSRDIRLPLPRLRNIYFVAMTDFGPDLPVNTAYPGSTITGTMPIAFHKRKQLYLAETEKFAHVTYFLNGGFADAVAGEERMMVPSPVARSYADCPEMSAAQIAAFASESLLSKKHDFIVLNFANADMVGHTGNLKATIRAAECVDENLGKIWKTIEKLGGVMAVVADHGNADCMWDQKVKMPMTFHTKNPVPFIIAGKKFHGAKLNSGGVLGNVSTTICDVLDLKILREMKAKSLF